MTTVIIPVPFIIIIIIINNYNKNNTNNSIADFRPNIPGMLSQIDVLSATSIILLSNTSILINRDVCFQESE